MSAAAELARAEADELEAAEADEQTPEPEPELEPESFPEQPPAARVVTEQQAERITDQAAKAGARYLDAQVKRLEPLDLPLVPCPLCVFPGIAIPRSEHEVTSDVVANVLGLIGQSAPQEYQAATDYERCPACDGWGEVLTGAQKEISRTAPCNACGGKGFKGRLIVVAPPQGAPAQAFPGQGVDFIPLPQGVNDGWGRPAGHPHWGRNPAEIGA